MVESNTSDGVKLSSITLKEFEDAFPNNLPLGLPSLKGINYQIDLLPSAPLPNKPAYRRNLNESKELQQQI